MNPPALLGIPALRRASRSRGALISNQPHQAVVVVLGALVPVDVEQHPLHVLHGHAAVDVSDLQVAQRPDGPARVGWGWRDRAPAAEVGLVYFAGVLEARGEWAWLFVLLGAGVGVGVGVGGLVMRRLVQRLLEDVATAAELAVGLGTTHAEGTSVRPFVTSPVGWWDCGERPGFARTAAPRGRAPHAYFWRIDL